MSFLRTTTRTTSSTMSTSAFVPLSPLSNTISSSSSAFTSTTPRHHHQTKPKAKARRHTHTCSATLAVPIVHSKPKPSTTTPVHKLHDSDALTHHLKQSRQDQVTVVKCHAAYCPGCRGAAPKYRKIAAAYQQQEQDSSVSFFELDYTKNEDFCKNALGVINLPFFAVFKGTDLVSAQSIGWRSVGTTLVDNIEQAILQFN